MAEFKLGRIKFVWKGSWATSTTYYKDDVIRINGKVYICVVGHTASTDFNTDLNNATPRWQLMSDGQFWKGNWATTTQYQLGDIVKWGGLLYICVTSHISQSTLEADQAKWDLYGETLDWKSTWATATYYKVNDVVKYGATTYLCNTSHTSAATAALGLEQDQAKWDIINRSFEYLGNWTTATRYKLNDIVKYGANLYICTTQHTSSAFISNEANWAIFVEGLQFEDTWSSVTLYQPGDIVGYGGYVYVAVTNHSNLTPTSNPAAWELLSTGFKFQGDWSSATAYKVGDVVRLNGYTYLANADNSNAEPGVSGSWTLLNTGIKWQGSWASATSYKLGDAIAHNNSSYIAVQRHTSTNGVDRPDNDITGTYWNLLAGGAETNVLTTAGDIVYYSPSGAVRLPIGTPGQVLTVQSGAPTWNTFGDITGVYYVGPNGVDDPAYGNTLDRPFKTLRYATENVTAPATIFLKTGTYSETLPIIVPANVSIVGDELRTAKVQPAAASVHASDVTPTLNSIAHLKSIVSNIVQNIAVTPTSGNTATQNTSLTSGSSAAGTSAENLYQAAYDYVNYYLKSVGSAPALTGSNTASVVSGYVNAVAVLNANKDFIADEAVAYTNANNTTSCTNTTTGTNRITCSSTSWMSSNMAVRFTGTTFGGINTGTTYYVTVVSGTQFTVSLTRGGAAVALTTSTGTMTASYYYNVDLCKRDAKSYVDAIKYDLIYTGNYKTVLASRYYKNAALGSELEDMFYVRNNTIVRNLTLQGLTGTLGTANSYGTRRPTAGAYVSLDTGYGVGDTNAHISSKSPYIQNVTTFGTAATGLKVDGSLHNAGYKSIVCNDFTQVISDGIGLWVTHDGRVEAVSVFTYYAHIGYLTEHGGKIRGTNGNNSYGTFGSVSEGINVSETAITASVNNRAREAQIGQVFTSGSSIYRLEFTNAGTNYSSATYTISGSGLNAATISDEYRDGAVFEVRLMDPGDSTGPGGANYITITNSAQSGNTTTITLAASDTNASGVYTGMRILITSGFGVGQYGYIQSYNSGTKVATIYKESTGTAGWDHIVPGTAIAATLDSTTAYIIEPRITFTDPGFTSTARTLASATWTSLTYSNSTFVAVASGSTDSSYSTNGTSWTAGGALPASTTWTGLSSGAVGASTYFVTVGGTTNGAYSTNGGTSWTAATMPASATWVDTAYGSISGTPYFVAVANSGTTAAYSTNGTSWSSSALPTSATWSHVVFGNGVFVAVSSGGTATAYSTNGTSWTAGGALPSSTTWTSVTYGNGRFVAIASGGTAAAYSIDNGVTWTASTLPATSNWSSIEYGHGLFFAVSTSGTQAATSPDGITWTSRTMSTSASGYTDVVFGNPSSSGIWAAVGGGTGTVASSTVTGATTLARAKVAGGKLAEIRIIEPGSGYSSAPTMTITDPNNTVETSFWVRTGNGALANPSFSNRGTGYSSATATVTGNGYADIFQTLAYIDVTGMTNIPVEGSNVQFGSITGVWYKLVSVTNLTGSAPNYTARLQISPTIGVAESPPHADSITIRLQYSQVRLTGHDFLNIGTGNFIDSNYPNTPVYNPSQANEVIEQGGGRVFYTSTDQDGNFRVGELFTVEQATGVATLNADAFSLSGLQELQLGSVSLGGSNVAVSEFSVDGSFAANSDSVVPTQKAIKTYISSQIGGGGSSLNVNSITAGSIQISGSTISTTSSATINVTTPMNFTRSVRGTPVAIAYFLS